MNLFTRSIVGVASLLAASILHAQAKLDKPAGLLGIRYLGIELETEHLTSAIPDHSRRTGLDASLPVSSQVVLGVGYRYSHGESSAVETSSHLAFGSATYYRPISTMKFFAGASLGHQWAHLSYAVPVPFPPGLTVMEIHNRTAVWGVTLGLEIPVRSVTLTPAISYMDGFEDNYLHATTYSVEASHWFTRALAGYVGASRTQSEASQVHSSNYRAGIRVKF